ncbi:MAG: hypothetical protein U5N27_18120 [Rhizobium sp.]|nr:hypothetical protein [Rhizobium sp.]
MPLFDRILIVDWSGAGQPVTGKNSLWACLARREGDGHVIEWNENFSTRHAFMQRLNTVVGFCCEARANACSAASTSPSAILRAPPSG